MSDEFQAAVYNMANRYRGTIYIGVVSALWNRVCDNKNETLKAYFQVRVQVVCLVLTSRRYGISD